MRIGKFQWPAGKNWYVTTFPHEEPLRDRQGHEWWDSEWWRRQGRDKTGAYVAQVGGETIALRFVHRTEYDAFWWAVRHPRLWFRWGREFRCILPLKWLQRRAAERDRRSLEVAMMTPAVPLRSTAVFRDPPPIEVHAFLV